MGVPRKNHLTHLQAELGLSHMWPVRGLNLHQTQRLDDRMIKSAYIQRPYPLGHGGRHSRPNCLLFLWDMWSPDGSCFPICNLLNNSMTSNDVDLKKKKRVKNVSGRETPSSIEIHFYEIMVSRDNDMCCSELL